ncbi:MAG: fumarylacetoacetate hydrolase family protein [Thermoleophilia bacterium]
MSNRISDAAHALFDRRLAHEDALLPADLAPQDLAEAYATHLALLDVLMANGGGPQIGWKVGFTNAAAQARNGSTEPVFAGLLAGNSYVEEAELASPGGAGLGVEAEIAVRLSQAISGPISRQEAADAIDGVAIAFEIVQPRCKVDDAGLPTLVADGTQQYGTILGEWNTEYDPMTLDQTDVKLQIDGFTDAFMNATEVLGHPLNAITWLSEATARYGVQLQAGDVILTGAIIPAKALESGQMAELASDGLGDIRVWVD